MLGCQPTLTESRQLYHLTLDGGFCELAVPDADLISCIDYYWLLTIDEKKAQLEVVPDTAVDLVISPDIFHFAALYFPVADKFCIELEGPVQYAGICFRSSHVSELLHQELDALAKLSIGSDIINNLNLQGLLTDIQNKKTLQDLKITFDRFWLARLDPIRRPETSPGRIKHEELINVLEQSLGTSSIASVCAALDISERQFRRTSHDLFGISPKKLQNILRLQAALEELFLCESNQIRDIYYDDSHRIRELKRLTGCTPKQILRMAEKYNNR